MVVEIEALLPIANLDDVKRKFRDLRTKYAKGGMIDRNKKTQLDRRVEAVELSIKEAEQEKWRRTDPGARARATEVVNQLVTAIEDYEKKAATAEANGDSRRAQEMREAAAARRLWLAEAQRGLADFAPATS